MTSRPRSELVRLTPDSPSSATPPRRYGLKPALIWASGAVAAAVIVVAVMWLGNTAPEYTLAGGEPTASPSSPAIVAPSTPGATPAPADALTETGAEDSVGAFLGTLATASFTAADLGSLTSVADGAILEEIRADTLELEANGWTKRGEALLDSVTVLDSQLDATPQTARVQACVDSSAVQILDQDGVPMAAPISPRSLNIYSLALVDSVWKVTDRSFPNDPSC